MSTFSSRMSASSKSSGPENAVSSTTKLDSGGKLVASRAYAEVIPVASCQPLVERWQRIGVRPPHEHSAEHVRGSHPDAQDAARQREQDEKNDDAVPSDLFVSH